MDESPRQLIRETRTPVPAGPGRVARHDYEYERCGVCSVLMAVEPLSGQRTVRVTQRRTRTDWAHFLNNIARLWQRAEKITLVMDNLNTHGPGSLYDTFEPGTAKALWDRFEFVYTPKHGSWLNMAEIELNVLIRQCLDRRMKRYHQGNAARGYGLERTEKQRERHNRLAVHGRECPHQTEASISNTSDVT